MDAVVVRPPGSSIADQWAKAAPVAFVSTYRPTVDRNVQVRYLECTVNSKPLSIRRTSGTKKMTNHVIWEVPQLSSAEAKTADKIQVIELTHGLLLGKRRLLVNGALVEKSSKFFDTGSLHDLFVNGMHVKIHIVADNVSFRYVLEIDGSVAVDPNEIIAQHYEDVKNRVNEYGFASVPTEDNL